MELFDLLGRRSPSRILRLFLERPTTEMQLKQIESATKLAKLSVLKWTKELVKYGVLSAKTIGRTNLYKLNRNEPSVRYLMILYSVDYINSELGKIKENVQIFLYGSFARGENTERSDIDILVIGKARNVIRKLKALDERIKISFYTPLEWSMTARKNRAFFESIEKDKINLRQNR